MHDFAETLLSPLNEAQRQGVLTTEGPCMIVAGAGSGKTKTLVSRVAYLIGAKAVDPFSVLVLTFTNKAAQEMKARIVHMVGEAAKNMWMGTFHSVFSRILRTEAEQIGHTPQFSIYDTEDSKKLIADIVQAYNLPKEDYKAAKVLYRISDAKSQFISWQEYPTHKKRLLYDRKNKIPELPKIYERYAERCYKANAMDFDDLLLNTQKLFKNHPEVLHKYQERFAYVLIDEFQDTNPCQYMIVKTLAAKQRNLCVVGDDSQSIYSFRGADVGNMLSFQKDYKDLHLFRLEKNYRSTQHIVEVSNRLIANNHLRIDKKIWTENEEGEPLQVIRALSNEEEAKLVANHIFEQKVHYRYRHADFAVLYRNSSHSPSIEDALRKNNLPYKVYGGVSFYQRKEVKDVLAYLRLLVNPHDEQALVRVINYPKRGIGDVTLDRLRVRADEEDVSLWEVMQAVRKSPSRATERTIGQFVALIEEFVVRAGQKDVDELALDLVQRSGMMALLEQESWGFSEKDKWKGGKSPQIENVDALLQGIETFMKDEEEELHTLAAFLQQVSLLTNADEDKEEDAVSLMTIHSCKGLEFKVVFTVGLVEGTLPDFRANTPHAMEEERRIFYVALTRAKEKVFILHPNVVTRYRRTEHCKPSRFLAEIEGKGTCAKNSEQQGSTGRYRQSFGHGEQPTFSSSRRSKGMVRLDELKGSKTSETDGLTVGTKVWHSTFGEGVIKERDVYQDMPKAKVLFEKVGEKTLLLAFAKLKILP